MSSWILCFLRRGEAPEEGRKDLNVQGTARSRCVGCYGASQRWPSSALFSMTTWQLRLSKFLFSTMNSVGVTGLLASTAGYGRGGALRPRRQRAAPRPHGAPCPRPSRCCPSGMGSVLWSAGPSFPQGLPSRRAPSLPCGAPQRRPSQLPALARVLVFPCSASGRLPRGRPATSPCAK